MGWLLWPELDQANLGDDANNYGPILGPSSKEIGLKLVKIASFEVRAAAEVRAPFRRKMRWGCLGLRLGLLVTLDESSFRNLKQI